MLFYKLEVFTFLVNHVKMAFRNSPSIWRYLFPSNNLISSKVQFELCNAWNELTHYGRWCERDNPETWVKFASHFNSSSVGMRLITPEKLKSMWLKMEEYVSKFKRYCQEMKIYSSTGQDFNYVAVINFYTLFLK